MSRLHGLVAASLLALVGLAQPSWAGISTFSGQDDGASTSGPWPNSTAAQTSFEAAAGAFGSLQTATFESVATGFYSPIAASPGLSIALNEPNYGSCFSGVMSCSFGNLYGFNTTSGGANYLAMAGGSATFNFSTPTNSLGMFITGIQTVFTSTFTLAFNDGTVETLNIPINVNGGAEYFGFTDTTPIVSATITNLSDDAWGLDDVTYNGGASVPEPAGVALLGTGLLGLGLLRRRKV